MWWKYICIATVIVALIHIGYLNIQVYKLRFLLDELAKKHVELLAEHDKYVRKRNKKGQFVKNNLENK